MAERGELGTGSREAYLPRHREDQTITLPHTAAREPDELQVFAVAATLLRHSRAIVAWALIAAVAVVGYTLLEPREYTAMSSFVPQARRTDQTSLSALAAQFGTTLLGMEPSHGSAFYVDLVTSRELLGRVVEEPFTFPTDTGRATMTLVQWYRVKGPSPAVRRELAVEKLRDDLHATTVTKTGVVRLEVTLRNPVLAAQVNQRLLDLVNEFNLRSRQSQAGQERRFVEGRIAEVRADLRAAEDRLAAFLQQNREYATAPELRFQHDRLAREVQIQQQLFLVLAQSYEQAKIDEVRDTPVISVVEHPNQPARPDPRFLAVKTILALLAGGFLGLLGALGSEFLRRARASEMAAYAQFQAERERAREKWRGRLSPLARVFRGTPSKS